jgi:hypothetical protein
LRFAVGLFKLFRAGIVHRNVARGRGMAQYNFFVNFCPVLSEFFYYGVLFNISVKNFHVGEKNFNFGQRYLIISGKI